MGLVYTPLKKIALISLLSFFSLFFFGDNLGEAETLRPFQVKPSKRQVNLFKCGYRKKEINLKLPSQLSTSPPSQLETNRVEQENLTRCGEYRPPIGLTALIPSSNIGTTLSEYPTFFFYIPDVDLAGVSGEFILKNENNEQIYQEIVPLKAGDSIVSIQLSASPNLPPLEVGKSYYWVFSLLLDKIDRSSNKDVAGWIRRVEPTSLIRSQLGRASSKAKPAIYASNGIWYEALTSLANLRCESPNDPTILANWTSLLQQVALPEIATKPLEKCHQTSAF
jgi:Domain of Unknown Function (DUF928)